MDGSGKSALISQFITSEYRNAFADEITDNYENTVSINIGGQEQDLVFFEGDPTLVCLRISLFLIKITIALG